jgi:transcriptional regulator with XRE-family HTH domain
MKSTQFGRFFKLMRQKNGLTLRKFCLENGLDPGNISRIERGIAAPPSTQELLEKYATLLKIKRNTDDWYNFFDLAAAGSGKIPSYVMSDEELVNKLPLVFRTLRGEKVSSEKLDELSELIRKA